MKLIETVLIPEKKWYQARQLVRWSLATSDVIALTLSFISAIALSGLLRLESWDYVLKTRSAAQLLGLIQAYMVLTAFGLVAFEMKGAYTKRKPFSSEVREILVVTLALALINSAIFSLGKLEFSRAAFLLNWSLAPVMLLLCRAAAKEVLIKCGAWLRPVVIIGWGENAQQTALAFDGEPMMGYVITGFLIPNDRPRPSFTFHDRAGRVVPFINLGSDPLHTLSYLGDPQVVLALEQGGIETYQELIHTLSRSTQALQIVPAVRGLPLYGMEANHFFAHEVLLLTVRNNLARRLPQLMKRLFDLVVASLALCIGSPILLWIALNVARTGRPIFYGHQRIGQRGKSFACYKFRTMAPNADKLLVSLLERSAEARAEWSRDFKLKEDPRITAIGHFLRRTSLDELPQLWNVVKGDMSLVGPRPVVTAELERYGNQVEYYLEARPGITGLWQVSGRNDTTYETRVYLDAWYVKNWSLFSDIIILLRTVRVILGRKGAY